MSDGSGRVMRTELADLCITMVEEFNELLSSVSLNSRMGISSYFFEFCRHDKANAFSEGKQVIAKVHIKPGTKFHRTPQ